MSQPPTPFTLRGEDYQDAPAYFTRIFPTLNTFQRQVNACLSGGISFGDNIFSRSYSSNFTTESTYATGDFSPITFSWAGTSLPLAVMVTKISKADGTKFLGVTGTPQWAFQAGQIVVNYVPGLAPGTKYNITFLAF